MLCVLVPRLAALARSTQQAFCVFRRPSQHPSGSRATCVYVSWPVGLYNSSNALQRLLAGHGAGIINSSPWVGHGREVGPWWANTGTPCMHNAHQ